MNMKIVEHIIAYFVVIIKLDVKLVIMFQQLGLVKLAIQDIT